jgi:hypothetical protein
MESYDFIPLFSKKIWIITSDHKFGKLLISENNLMAKTFVILCQMWNICSKNRVIEGEFMILFCLGESVLWWIKILASNWALSFYGLELLCESGCYYCTCHYNKLLERMQCQLSLFFPWLSDNQLFCKNVIYTYSGYFNAVKIIHR